MGTQLILAQGFSAIAQMFGNKVTPYHFAPWLETESEKYRKSIASDEQRRAYILEASEKMEEKKSGKTELPSSPSGGISYGTTD